MGAIKEKLNLYRAIYEDRIEKLFKNLWSFLSKHPTKTLICCIIVNLLLALGILNIEFQNDVETFYIPEDSKSIKDRNSIKSLYGDPTGSNFAPYQLTRQGLYGDVLIVSRNKSSIMKPLYINEINSIDAFIREKNPCWRLRNAQVQTQRYLCIGSEWVWSRWKYLTIPQISKRLCYGKCDVSSL